MVHIVTDETVRGWLKSVARGSIPGSMVREYVGRPGFTVTEAEVQEAERLCTEIEVRTPFVATKDMPVSDQIEHWVADRRGVLAEYGL